MDHKLKLMVVDDSPLFRTWLIHSLSADDRFQVVGYAVNALDAQEKIPLLQPDMLTLDIEMPGMSGIDFLKQLLPVHPIPVILVSSLNLRVFDALEAGAVDFVRKPDEANGLSKEIFLSMLRSKLLVAAASHVHLPSVPASPQAAKKRDGHVNCINSKLENISGSTIERLESYDKSEQIMIYLNKDHDIKDKYEDSDWIKTPLVIFLNNTYDLLIKKEVMKEYGFEEIEKEVKKMCNLGEMIARENIEKGHSMGLEQGQKLERIASIKNLMKKMAIPLDKAMDLLDLSSIEKEEMKKYFQA